MNRRSLAAIALVAAVLSLACGARKEGSHAPQSFGASVTVKEATPLASVAEAPATFAGQTIRVEGTVKAACQGRGCWVEVQDAKGASFLARSLDETVLVPKDCAGRKIVVQGVVTALPAEVKEEPQPADGHACPRPNYVLATQGIQLK
jgi:hypothetical protein